MASKNSYYGVFGSNGLGVVNSWEKAQKAMKNLEKSNVVGTKTFYEAKRKALENYNIRGNDDFMGPIPLNFVIRKEQIEKIKGMKLEPEDQIDVVINGKKIDFVKK